VAKAVRLLGVPAALYVETLAHLDALLRELRLIVDSIEQGTVPRVSIEMAHGIEDLLALFGGIRGRTAQLACDAIDRGEETLDLSFNLPDGAPAAMFRLVDLLEQADGWAANGDLLNEPADPRMVRMRRWIEQEVTVQVAGGEPTPWAG